jgi:hypothetical protein
MNDGYCYIKLYIKRVQYYAILNNNDIWSDKFHEQFNIATEILKKYFSGILICSLTITVCRIIGRIIVEHRMVLL